MSLIQVPSHPCPSKLCKGSGTKISHDFEASSWANLAEKLREDSSSSIVELKPVQHTGLRSKYNKIRLPCGYLVLGCTCGNNDTTYFFEKTESYKQEPTFIGCSYSLDKGWYPIYDDVLVPEMVTKIHVTGDHTDTCLHNIGKTIESVDPDDIETSYPESVEGVEETKDSYEDEEVHVKPARELYSDEEPVSSDEEDYVDSEEEKLLSYYVVLPRHSRRNTSKKSNPALREKKREKRLRSKSLKVATTPNETDPDLEDPYLQENLEALKRVDALEMTNSS